jgi:hypothetical protein
MSTEERLKHLEFVQALVARMAGNSFFLKGWSVTLSAALFALAAKDSNPAFAGVALFPALSFWGLDAYYLRQERLCRRLYDELRLATDLVEIEPFALSVAKHHQHVDGWFRTLWSPTVIGLHGVVLVAILTVMLVLR